VLAWEITGDVRWLWENSEEEQKPTRGYSALETMLSSGHSDKTSKSSESCVSAREMDNDKGVLT